MKYIQYTLLFLFVSVFTLHASKSEARFNLLRISYTFNTDGSMDYHFQKELKLFTHTAMNRTYGETFIEYNPDFQKVTINEAYTIQKSGHKISLPDNAMIPVLPRCAANAPDFNHLKEMVIVHTGLELGATIYLDYTIHTKKGLYPFFELNKCIQQSSPISNCEVTISYPSKRPISAQIIGHKAIAKVTNNNGTTTNRYTFKNIPALSREPYQVKYDPSVLRIIASETDITKAIRDVKKKFSGTIPVSLKMAANKLMKTEMGKSAHINALRSLVDQYFAVKHIPYSLIGMTLRPFNIVCNSHYATSLEKTALLYNLLVEEGFQAELIARVPAYINSNNCGLESISSWIVRTQNQPNPSIQNSEDTHYYTLDGKKLNIESKREKRTNQKKLLVSKGQKENSYTILSLPTFKNGIDTWRMNKLSSMRNTILEIPSRIAEESKYTIDIDNGAHFLSSKYQKEITNKAGLFSQNIDVDGNRIIVTRKIKLDKRHFAPKEYEDLRILLNEWYDVNNHILVFSN